MNYSQTHISITLYGEAGNTRGLTSMVSTQNHFQQDRQHTREDKKQVMSSNKDPVSVLRLT